MQESAVHDPEVDVIIPAFNAARTIASATTSIQRQSLTALRIIVVDDGSTDETAAIVAMLAARDPRILVLRQENRGIAAALNRAISAGSARYVARQDADDLSDPNRIARQLDFLEKCPDIIAVSAAHREIGSDGVETGRVHRPPPVFEPDFMAAPAREPPLTQPFMMVRRRALETVGGYRPYPVSEDSDLYWRLLRLGRLGNLDAICGSYRMHGASISSASIRDGRIMAFCSQVAALSARRVAAGQPDIDLVPGWTQNLPPCGAVETMLTRAAMHVGTAEGCWLRVAAAAKLMELSGYRPYELEAQDCTFIRSALRDLRELKPANAREIRKMEAATAARLLRLGRPRDAARVAGPRLWPEMLARAGTGRLYWTKHLPAPASRRPVAA